METLVVASKEPFSIKQVENILVQHWRIEASTDNTLVVHGATSRAYLSTDVESENTELHRLLIDYSDVALVKSLIEKLANDPALVVDNDFGTVLPGDEFVKRCNADEAWDWRQ